VALPAAFDLLDVAAVSAVDSSPTLRLGADGRARLAFLAGPAGATKTFIATIDETAPNGPSIDVRRLTADDKSTSPPRLAITRAGEVVATYVDTSSDGDNPHVVSWSNDDDGPHDAPAGSDPVGETIPAIVVDALDTPILAHVFSDFSLRLMRRQAGSWQRETVEIGVIPFDSTVIDMTLDAAGQPALLGGAVGGTTYGGGEREYLPSIHGLTVWLRGASGWTRERVATDYPGIPGRLRLAPTGELQAFFADPGSATLGRAVRRGEQDWRVDVPLAGTDGVRIQTGTFDVAIGHAGEAHVAYAGLDGLVYAIYDGCRWSQMIVDGGFADAPTIALDAAGRPRIGYETYTGMDPPGEMTTMEVRYARPAP